jgi:hypothetical protein
MIPTIIIPDEADKKIADDTCQEVIDIICKIDRTDLRVYIMQMLVESFEESHNVILYDSRTLDKR